MNENIKIEEYRSLQEEHKKNRTYIFERPLLITAIVAAASQYIFQYQSSEGSKLLPSILKLIIFPLLIFVLYYNLTFTKDKLFNDSRIAAYIQLFLEDELAPHWIGWETSLRYYRKWMNINFNNDNNLEWRKNIEKECINRPRRWFYYKIYFFHLFFIFFLSITWIIAVYYVSPIASYVLILVLLCLSGSLLNSKNPLHYSKFDNNIEEQRAIWLDVYKTYIINHHKNLVPGSQLICPTDSEPSYNGTASSEPIQDFLGI